MNRMNIFILIIMLSAVIGRAEDNTILTIYEQNRTWVQEIRQCELPSRNGKIVLDDLPAQLDPETVHLKSITSGGQLIVMNHAFYTPLANAATLYQACIGQTIQVITESGESVSGKLLQDNPEILLQDDAGHLVVIPTHRLDHVILPPMGRRILQQPYLEFVVDNMSSINQQLELSYMTSQLGWHAHYSAELSDNEKEIALSGEVTIDNDSGKDYDNVMVVLIAGDVNWENQSLQNMPRRMPAKVMAMSEAASYDVQDEPVYEYHRYPFPYPFFIKSGESRKHHLIAGFTISVEKQYVYDSRVNPEKVVATLIGKNTTFMALPGGVLQLFRQNEDRSSMLIGESRLNHTPKDSEIKLTTGSVFDVQAERVQTSQNPVGSRMREESYEITFRSAKETNITIHVKEHFHGNWNLVTSSIPFKKPDSETVEFVIQIPKSGSNSLTYTVQTKW